MNTTEESAKAHDPQTGSEQGLRSGSTAGDSHGKTADAPGAKEENETDEQTPGDRRKELLKED